MLFTATHNVLQAEDTVDGVRDLVLLLAVHQRLRVIRHDEVFLYHRIGSPHCVHIVTLRLALNGAEEDGSDAREVAHGERRCQPQLFGGGQQ